MNRHFVHKLKIVIGAIAILASIVHRHANAESIEPPTPYYMHRLYLEPSAHHEQLLLTWDAPDHPIPTNTLALLDHYSSIDGWWETGIDAMGYSTAIGISRIKDSLFLIHYIYDDCTSAYRLYRHGTFTNGLLTLDNPIGDWSEPYNQLLFVTTTNESYLIPRTVAEKYDLVTVIKDSREIPMTGLRTGYFTRIKPNKHREHAPPEGRGEAPRP